MKLTRRGFFGLSAAAVLSGSYSFAAEPLWLRLRSYSLSSPKWPKDAKPLRIAYASDFHVGCPSVDLEKVKILAAKINALNADIILLGGDYLIQDVVLGKHVAPASIAESLSSLSAPLGVYSVLGNHDWWGGGHIVWEALEKVGIHVLENSAMKVQKDGHALWVAGMADDTTRAPDYNKTMAAVTDDAPVIMLAHDPASFMDIRERPVLTLCGHTHGGQVTIPFITPIVIPGRAPMKYAYGHIQEEGWDMIVSGGIGTSILPVRFGRRPEIVVIDLKASI